MELKLVAGGVLPDGSASRTNLTLRSESSHVARGLVARVAQEVPPVAHLRALERVLGGEGDLRRWSGNQVSAFGRRRKAGSD